MLRLTCTTESPAEVVLKAEGWIVAEWVSLLEEEIRRLTEPDRRVVLDLAQVSYLDGRAVRLIRRLAGGSLALVNCSPLVEELLAEDVP